MSISPFFSGKSDHVDSLAITSSLSSAHQSLNPSSPNVSPNLIGGSTASLGPSLQLPTVESQGQTNFYHSPGDMFLDGPPVDSSFKISSSSGGGATGLGVPDEELGSLYDFKRDQASQPPYMSGTSSGTSTLFSQAAIGSRLLQAERTGAERKVGGLDYMQLDNKPKYILGPTTTSSERGVVRNEEQEHTRLAKKVFERSRDEEPTIDAELRAIGIKGIPTIHTACVDGNLRLVKKLTIMRTADIEAKDILGSRPLHVASCYGHRDIISFLIRKGANVNAVDNYESTPLVVTQDQETVKLLVSFGANIHAKNVNDVSAKQLSLSDPYICYAIEQGQKWLRERAEKTKRFLGQIDKKFLNTEICKHWDASFKPSRKGTNVSIAAVSPGVPPITKGAPTGKDLSRKRRRNEMTIKVEPGVPRGKSSRKKC
mmetsp:Transcript_25718/g.43061  ORF Transcript_25718/g.43061 Transcript_25718/m.43061 type:complete len:428 (+) Transcript_25718:81-1364(+)